MEISLPQDLQQFVEEKVRAGQYANQSDVIRGALEVLKAQETLTPEDIEELRKEIAIGIEQADRGDFVEFDADQIKAEGRRWLAAKKGK